MRLALVLLLALAVAAGCGGGRDDGTATLWVTRDRGAHVLFAGDVPAGLTAMQALDRERKITTRYGGRYVQSIDGVEGSLAKRRDWFFFVNGREGDRSAAEVRLRDGDVEWWDFRSWRGSAMSVPVVVGSYPHPFVDAPTSVVPVGVDRDTARAIAKQVHGVVAATKPTRNYILLGGDVAPDLVRIKPFRRGAQLELGAAVAQKLADDPSALRYRYGVAE